MTPTPPPIPTTVPGFVVLDADLSDRPPLAYAGDYDAALYTLSVVQEQFYDQLDANGEGGHTVHLALALATIDATGTIRPPFYSETINGMRPAQR